MQLETVNALAQLIAAIGVIVSLFYLGAQIRQNTRSQRSIVVDSLTSSLINLLGPQAADPKLTRAFASAPDHPNLATVLFGATSPEQVRTNVRSVEVHSSLTREQLAAIHALVD